MIWIFHLETDCLCGCWDFNIKEDICYKEVTFYKEPVSFGNTGHP